MNKANTPVNPFTERLPHITNTSARDSFVKYYPFAYHLLEEIFDLSLENSPKFFKSSLSSTSTPLVFITGDSFPKIDIYVKDDVYTVEAVIAGIPKDEVILEINEYNQLVFSYEKSNREEKSDKKYVSKELTTKSFVRKLQLPDYVDINNVETAYSDGLVRISFKFLPEKKPKKLVF